MTEHEFAKIHFEKFRTSGNEIIPRLCPFCHGGPNEDKDTFYLNIEKHVYICHRGSCGKSGHFSELLRKFGHQSEDRGDDLMKSESKAPVKKDEEKVTKKVRKVHKPIPMPPLVNSAEEMEYLHSRGISDETARAFAVGGGGKGELIFPAFEDKEQFENNTPVSIKYRRARPLEKGATKMWRESNSPAVLFGMHLCKPENGRLYIFEGEFDALSGYQILGSNCISIPNGSCDLNWVEDHCDFLNQFTQIAVIGDNDEPGRAMVEKLILKLDAQVLVPDFGQYCGCKDANEILTTHGEEQLRRMLSSVHVAPISGLRDISSVNLTEGNNEVRVSSGIPTLDKIFGGGFPFSNLFVWTGKSGEGKSTLVSMLALEAINQGYPVCFYSGELSAAEFKRTLCLQAAGSNNVIETENEATNSIERSIPADVQSKIDAWLRGKIIILDHRTADIDNSDTLLNLFALARKQYQCRVFFLDNLMTVRASDTDADQYVQQGKFALDLKKFAMKNQSIIHLVLHARKSGEETVKYLGDISGSATVTNAASAVCAIARGKDQKTEEEFTVIRCLKNRMEGNMKQIRMKFIPASRQLIDITFTERQYQWEDADE